MDELRLFNNASIQRHVDEQLTSLPEDKHGAVIAYADEDKARMAIMARLSHGWSLVATVERDWGGDWDGSVEAKWSW